MNDHLKAHRDFQQRLNDSMIELRETFQAWLQQRQKQVVNLDSYTPEPSQCRKIPIYYDDDDDEESSIPLRDIIISELPPCIAITPVLLTEEPVDSLIMEDKHLDTISATESEELIKFSVEDLDEVLDDIISIPPGNGNDHFNDKSSLIESVLNRDNVISSPKIDFLLEEFAGELALIAPIPPGIRWKDFEDGEIDTDILLTIKDDILREKLLNINLLIAKIEALKDNPTPSFDFVTKSPSISPNSFLEETNISYNSLPESETFYFNLEEKSSGNPTFYTDLSLPDYEAFFCDSEPDSGDFTIDSFVLKSPIPVEDGDSFLEKSKITPELETFKFDIEEKNSGSTTIHADISLSNLEFVYFKSVPDLRDLTSIDPGIRENVSSMTNVNLPFEDDQSPLFAYVV
ncbi:hypothetical protein Tco_1038603 [Tanacetum coccineum]